MKTKKNKILIYFAIFVILAILGFYFFTSKSQSISQSSSSIPTVVPSSIPTVVSSSIPTVVPSSIPVSNVVKDVVQAPSYASGFIPRSKVAIDVRRYVPVSAPVVIPPAPVVIPPAPVVIPPAPVVIPPAPVATQIAPVATQIAPVATQIAPVATQIAPQIAQQASRSDIRKALQSITTKTMNPLDIESVIKTNLGDINLATLFDAQSLEKTLQASSQEYFYYYSL